MGGVDKMDQNIGAYMINIPNKKWWWPLFQFSVDLTVNNAFQLYRLQPLIQGQNDLIYWDLEEKLSRYIMQDFDRRKLCLLFSQKTPKESI